MALRTLNGTLKRNLTKYFGTPLLLIVLASAILIEIDNGFEFYTRLEQSRTAGSDIRVWSVSQAEVDHTNLLLALDELRVPQGAAGSPEALKEGIESRMSEISVAFDIFYSRLGVVLTILDKPDVPQDVRAPLTALIESRDQLAVMFDRSDLLDPAQMIAIRDAVDALDVPVRSLVLGALDHFVTEAAAARELERASSQRFFTGSIVFLITMSAAVWIALMQHRRLSRQFSVIESQNANMRLVYESSLVAVVVTNKNADIRLLNSAAEQTFGYSEAEAKGLKIADLFIPHYRLESHIREMKRFRDTGQGIPINQGAQRSTMLHKDGTEFPVELSIRSEVDAAGEEILIAFVRDISEQMAFESNLREARDEAQRHAAAKTMFLATMSHEMRTPLHGLLASLDLIETADFDVQARDLIQTARNCGLQTLHQINDVLELTQIGEVKEPLTPFSPQETVSNIMDELLPLARDHNNQLVLDVTNYVVGSKWLGFPQMFLRAMYNLVGNALKFTQDGSVTIDLSFNVPIVDAPQLRVSVKDTGRGISSEDQSNLFDLFFVADAGRMGAQFNSSGLGLPIVQAAVKKMGGTMTVESQLGLGSTFSFEIPLMSLEDSQSPQLADVAAPSQLSPGLRCLVVDDNRVNLDLTAQMLRRLGCDAVTCDSGEGAVVRLGVQVFDVVLMDLNMPGGMSGEEATQLIRQQEAGQASTAPVMILALTADTTVTISTAVGEQFDDVLHKPLQMNELQKTLSRLLSGKTAGSVPEDSAADTSPEAVPNAFSDLFELIGQEHGARLLNGVLDDIDSAVGAIRHKRADVADQLHRAVGSTAAVGLLEFSQQLRRAEDLARANSKNALSKFLTSIELGAHRAQERILQAQDNIRETDP